jgi:hypothetical protein
MRKNYHLIIIPDKKGPQSCRPTLVRPAWAMTIGCKTRTHLAVGSVS